VAVVVLLSFFLVAAVSAGWIYFFWRLDKHEKEPLFPLAMCVVFGALSAVLALFLEEVTSALFSFGFGDANSNPFLLFFYLVLVVGLIEELAKFLPVYFYAFRTEYFNEPMDGLVYASASAVGFLFVEDVIYVLVGFQLGFSEGMRMVVARILTSPVHLLLASYWGVELGFYKKDPSRLPKLIFSVALAAFIHGLYNFLAYAGLEFLLFVLVALIAGALARKVKFLNRISPFNTANYLIGCVSCGFKMKANSQFCPNCGKETDWIEKVEPSSLDYFCSNCESKLSFGQDPCPSCGSKIKW